MSFRYIVIDFESYYSQTYSLQKMTPPEYVLSPLFASHGASIILGNSNKPFYLEHHELVALFARLKQSGKPIAMISHNALFDMCVLAWRYGYIPKLMIDTMGMARTLLGHKLKRFNLDTVAQYLGLPAKGKFLQNVIGMTLAEIKARGWWPQYTEYANLDNTLCHGIFLKLRDQMPPDEWWVMDAVIRCAVAPKFILDRSVLAQHKFNLEQEKEQLLINCGLSDRSELMSNDKFAEALRRLGVEPEMKMSLRTNKETYAFAKSDPFMVALDDHDDSMVQALVAARVGHKSTLEETRTQRFINIANLDAGQAVAGYYPQGAFPVPLRYGAAHTHRLGGDWKLNAQNMPRKFVRPGVPDQPGRLRTSLSALPGYSVVTGDAAQIEARINAVLNEQDDLVEAFRQGRDIYSEFAGDEIYHKPVTKSDKAERFVGKQSILGLGYQMGPPKFQNTVRVQSRQQLGMEMLMPLVECANVVGAYRRRFFNISGSWARLRDQIPLLANADSGIQYGPVTFGYQEIVGPNGLKLHYDGLQRINISGQWKWRFTYGRDTKDLYGGKLLENIVQFLARIHIMEAAKRVWLRTRYYFIMQVHDELIYMIPDAEVEAFKLILKEELERPPVWMPNIPLGSDVGHGQNYGEAK